MKMNLYIKKVLCLVVCFVCHINVSQIIATIVTFLVPLESPQWEGVHWICLIMFLPIVEKLLIMKLFFHWKFIWIKTSKYKKFGCPLGVVRKVFSKLLDLKCEKYWILNSFCHWKFNQQKMVLQRKLVV